jgi:hypothetical protein
VGCCVVSEIVYDHPASGKHPESFAGDDDVSPDTGVRMSSSKAPQGFTPTGTIATSADRRRVVFATVVGTTVEWYDFFIYAFAAGLVFAELFFAPAGEGFAQISRSSRSASASCSARSARSWPGTSATSTVARSC